MPGARSQRAAGSRAACAQAAYAPSTQFFPASCAATCAFEDKLFRRLPDTPSPKSGGNRVTQWADVVLSGVRRRAAPRPAAARGRPRGGASPRRSSELSTPNSRPTPPAPRRGPQIRANIGKMNPPLIARTLGVYSTAVYDAVAVCANGIRMAPVYADRAINNGRCKSGGATLDTAISGAAYNAITSLFGSYQAFLEPAALASTLALASQFLNATGDDPASPAFAAGAGAASAVFGASQADGFLAAPAQPPAIAQTIAVTTDPATCAAGGLWQRLCVPPRAALPTPAAIASAGAYPPPAGSGAAAIACASQRFAGLAAATAVPFALPSAGALLPTLPGPDALGSDASNAEMDQVLSISGSLSDFEKTVAEFWADGPDTTAPPGHWFRIAVQQSSLRGVPMWRQAILLFAVGNALRDAGVAAWAAKAATRSARPLTGIQCRKANQTLQAWRGPYIGNGPRPGSQWQPFQLLSFVTPPFPGYVSGHSTFSAAAAEVLTRYLGGDYGGPSCARLAAGGSTIEPKVADPAAPGYAAGLTDAPAADGGRGRGYSPSTDVVLCWGTFTDAAQQSGVSRLYGGIHVQKDNADGLALGKAVAAAVISKVNTFTGPAFDSQSGFSASMTAVSADYTVSTVSTFDQGLGAYAGSVDSTGEVFFGTTATTDA
jgi:hypothetical protein